MHIKPFTSIKPVGTTSGSTKLVGAHFLCQKPPTTIIGKIL